MAADDITVHAAPLTAAVAAIVRAGGSSADEADAVATGLVEANLKGHDSHGVGMLPRYIDALKEGGLFPNRKPIVRADIGTMLTLDGDRGYGQSIARAATAMAIERAKRHGSCIMALGEVHHLGRIGQWAEQALAANLVSIHFVNVRSRPIVAPYAGGDGRFGTNPCCIGVPVPGGEPFVLDFATSVVAQGKMRVAHNKGESVPAGRLIDDRGAPTEDPRYAVVPPFGALMPFGEHKGYGLAIACELLGGALAGGGTWRTPYTGAKRVYNGMLSILIDPARLGTADFFGAETSAFLEWLRAGPVGVGHDKVRIAGEPEREARAERSVAGIAIDAATWEEILAAGEKVGVARADTRRAAGG